MVKKQNNIIKIRYEPQETGPAELLDGHLARIVDVPVLTTDFWRNDIVRLTHLPDESDGFPSVAEVVFTRHDCRSFLKFTWQDVGAQVLMDIFSLLHIDSAVTVAATEEKPGILSVAHPAFIDPGELLKVLGATVPLKSRAKKKLKNPS